MDYETYQIFKEKEFEAVCLRCGHCCGSADDPCVNLIARANGTFECDIYENRGGRQKTRSGKFFQCVSIRKILHQNWSKNWDCAYKKI